MPTDDDSPTLTVDETDGLSLPPEYAGHEGGLSIRVPTTTIQISGNAGIEEYVGVVRPRHFDVESSRDPKNEHLAPDKVSLKKHGEPAETFDVVVGVTAP